MEEVQEGKQDDFAFKLPRVFQILGRKNMISGFKVAFRRITFFFQLNSKFFECSTKQSYREKNNKENNTEKNCAVD